MTKILSLGRLGYYPDYKSGCPSKFAAFEILLQVARILKNVGKTPNFAVPYLCAL